MQMLHKRPEDLEIKVRSPEFDVYSALEKNRYWLGGDPVLSHFVSALQAIFPEGERWFIDAARDVAAQVGTENLPDQLRKDIRAFIRQEAHHGMQHEEWTEALVKLGYPKMQDFDDWLKEHRVEMTAKYPAMRRLAATVAAEHLTACIAELLMDTDLLERADAPLDELLAWHALEETEHKAVCFDLFYAAGGTYLQRAWAMGFEIVLISLYTHLRYRYLMQQDGNWNTKYKIETLQKIWAPKGLMGRMFFMSLPYFKPSFHPWDADIRHTFRQRFASILTTV